jgi:hypothetical protein
MLSFVALAGDAGANQVSDSSARPGNKEVDVMSMMHLS